MSTQSETISIFVAGGLNGVLWLANSFLNDGYTVRLIVINPDDSESKHLLKGRLSVVKADLLDSESVREAISGSFGVVLFASDPDLDDDHEQKVAELATTGTRNVIAAAAESKVRRVLLALSTAALDEVASDSCLRNTDFYKKNKQIDWYRDIEEVAVDTARARGVDLIVLNSRLAIGPLSQPTTDANTKPFKKYPIRSADSVQAYVDVRDVARACILLFETPSADGRYVFAERMPRSIEVDELLAKCSNKNMIPIKDEPKASAKPYSIPNQKLKAWGFECFYEGSKSLLENCHFTGESTQTYNQEHGRAEVLETVVEIQQRRDDAEDLEMATLELQKKFSDFAAVVEARSGKMDDKGKGYMCTVIMLLVIFILVIILIIISFVKQHSF